MVTKVNLQLLLSLLFIIITASNYYCYYYYNHYYYIYNFCRKYLILALPTKANLKTWNIIENSTCDLCKQKSETQHHIVSDCQTAAVEKRYTWSHNSVLYTIANYMSTMKSWGIKVNQLLSKYTEVACRATYYISTDVENHGM